MAPSRNLLSALLITFTFILVTGEPSVAPKEPVSEACLGCICEAVSDCKVETQCAGDVCGLFKITWAYWSDAGKPVNPGENPNSPDAYANCAKNPVCAAQSVINYMNRFGQDCNHDGQINCYDYAYIHKLGGYGCSGLAADNPYLVKFDQCARLIYNQSVVAPGPTQPTYPHPPTQFAEESQNFGQQIQGQPLQPVRPPYRPPQKPQRPPHRPPPQQPWPQQPQQPYPQQPQQPQQPYPQQPQQPYPQQPQQPYPQQPQQPYPQQPQQPQQPYPQQPQQPYPQQPQQPQQPYPEQQFPQQPQYPQNPQKPQQPYPQQPQKPYPQPPQQYPQNPPYKPPHSQQVYPQPPSYQPQKPPVSYPQPAQQPGGSTYGNSLSENYEIATPAVFVQSPGSTDLDSFVYPTGAAREDQAPFDVSEFGKADFNQ